jgi:NitT/TauT family transport system permease protein/sulfonate transport system permease protein
MSQKKILSNVVFPSSMPQIFNGLQIGLFLSIVVTSVSEMISSGAGLGQNVILAMDYYRTAEALAYLLIIMIIGIVANAIFKQIRSVVLDWTEDNDMI